jgi:hypothetical protein
LLFNCPPSLPVHFFGSLFFSISFSFFSFFLDFVSFPVVTQLIINYTLSQARNGAKWNDGKTKKDGKYSPLKNKLV